MDLNPMNALSLLLAALSTGAAAALKETAGQAVKDAYQSLKGMILRRLGDKPAAKEIVERYPTQPEIWGKPLEQLLSESGADRDKKLLQTAGQLMALVNPQQAAAGKYNVQITGTTQGIVVGDQANVTMNFGGSPQKKTPRKS